MLSWCHLVVSFSYCIDKVSSSLFVLCLSSSSVETGLKRSSQPPKDLSIAFQWGPLMVVTEEFSWRAGVWGFHRSPLPPSSFHVQIRLAEQPGVVKGRWRGILTQRKLGRLCWHANSLIGQDRGSCFLIVTRKGVKRKLKRDRGGDVY